MLNTCLRVFSFFDLIGHGWCDPGHARVRGKNTLCHSQLQQTHPFRLPPYDTPTLKPTQTAPLSAVLSAPEPCEGPSVQSEGILPQTRPRCAGWDWSRLVSERGDFSLPLFPFLPTLWFSFSRRHAMMFRDQVGILTDWFKGWNECEQTVALLSLLKRVSRTQARFLHICLEHWLADCTEIHILEAEANNAGTWAFSTRMSNI